MKLRVHDLFALNTVTVLLVFCWGDPGPDAFCEKDGECRQAQQNARDENADVKLTMINTNKVGEETLFEDGNRTLKMRTLSVKPSVFEIPDFLTEEECEHFIHLAKTEGLQSSATQKYKDYDEMKGRIRAMDVDNNKQLTISEMMLTLENSFDIYLDDQDVLKMYKDLDMDTNGDEIIERRELDSVAAKLVMQYLRRIIDEQPGKQSRFSKQAWIFPSRSKDTIFKSVQERVQKLMKLPLALIKRSDFQVVNYGAGGHYHAHIDSATVRKDVPCCYQGISTFVKCRICRFATVLFYLNDVQQGGATAFPVAGNKTYDEKILRTSHKINLRRHCDDANLVVQPERGKALVWYNHKIDESTGWLGPLDVRTWHGGCPVVMGDKWIANFWIKATDDKNFDLNPPAA